MTPDRLIPTLLLVAWLAPLASFVVIAVAGALLVRSEGAISAASARTIARVATGAVLLSLAASLAALAAWVGTNGATPAKPHVHHAEHADRTASEAAAAEPSLSTPVAYTGEWFRFLEVGPLEASAGYYIDALAVLMAVVVTLVASCVHVYAMGYLAEETAAEGDDAVTDLEVTTYYGEPFRRAGRLHRFYQHLSLFTFAMLGIVLAGNALQTFVFWELVGATSYLLIGFYYERPKAAAAANKAMLVNRFGDVGMLVGLMALWSLAGSLEYRGLFAQAADWLSTPGESYALLTIGAAGMVLGCLGKSAQAPLWSWLPDAMAGPTPVSALVHSATMVAAGVFLIARLTPLMPVEVLLGVAVIGAVTLLLGAVLATAATDLKRVLAFSTISQLGFMTLSLGLGGWTAALFHLVTHAAFKALLFLGAGSVMHGAGTGDLGAMGGLRRPMPRTALLIGVGLLALVGAGLPIVGVGLSGFYSKDAIFEQAVVFARTNPGFAWLFWAPVLGAGLTALYATRLWLVTFGGEPRSAAARGAHESGVTMLGPMALLAVGAVAAGWSVPFAGASIKSLVETAAPTRIAETMSSPGEGWAALPAEATGHTPEVRRVAGLTATGVTLLGVVAGWLLHRGGRPLTTPVGKAIRGFDLRGVPAVDRAIDVVFRGAGATVATVVDRGAIDGGLASATRLLRRGGRVLQAAETGNVRQYVSFLALGVVVVCIVTLSIARQWTGEG